MFPDTTFLEVEQPKYRSMLDIFKEIKVPIPDFVNALKGEYLNLRR